MIFICGRYAEVRPVANSEGSETFPADTVSSDMVPKPIHFVPTYLLPSYPILTDMKLI